MRRSMLLTAVALVLVVLMPVALFAAGQGEEEEAVGEVELAYNEDEGYTEFLRDMLDDYPFTSLNPLSGTSEDQLDYYTIRFAAGDNQPALAEMDIVWPATFAAAGWVAPVDEYVSEEDLDPLIDAYRDALTIEGELVAFPAQADALGFYYRTDLLEEYGYDGPPETWQEMIEMADTITEGEDDPDLQGFLFQGANIEGLLANYLTILWGMGGDVVDQDGNVIINDETGVEALQLMVDFIYEYGVSAEGVTTDETDDSRVAFQDGRGVFTLNWMYAYSLFDGDDSPIQGDFALTTPPSSPGYDPGVALGGWHWAVNANAADPEAAIEVAQHLTSYEVQKERVIRQTEIPTREDVYEDEEVLEAQPWLEEFLPVVQQGRMRPLSDQYSQVSEAIRDELSNALAQIKSPQEALDDAAARLDDLTIFPPPER